MYKNVGKKIMVLAQVFGWVCLIAGAIVFIQSIPAYYNGPEPYGWISLAAGVVGFLCSWPLFGFGQIVDDVNAMRRSAEKPAEAASSEELPEL